MPFVGCFNTRITNPRWRTAAILKNRKIAIFRPRFERFWRPLVRRTTMHFDPLDSSNRYKFEIWKIQDGGGCHLEKSKTDTIISAGLSDFNKIWHSDAVQPSWPFRSLRIKFLKIQDGGRRHLEKWKNQDISATVSPIGTFGMMMHIGRPNRTSSLNFELLKIQDGGRPLF